jgi:hypothetical protein
MLWLHDPTWDEWVGSVVPCGCTVVANRRPPTPLSQVYPFASAIDTPLPKAEKTLAIMRSSCPEHVPVPEGSVVLQKYNDEGIEQWHKNRKLWVD